MQQLAPVEKAVFETVNPAIDKWRKEGHVNPEEIKSLGKSICSMIENAWPKNTK
jgi:hypothetical protein